MSVELPSERLRLFVAVDVPHELLVAADAAVRARAGSLSGARWTSVESRHVTLKFLGWTPSEELARIERAVGAVAGRHRRGCLFLSGVGAFPSLRRARVLWLGLADPEGLLTKVAADLDHALEPLGFVVEGRPFTPHLTLARFKSPVRIEPSIASLEVPGRPFEVASLRLYRSRLHPRGARYDALHDHSLRPSA